MKRMRTVVAKPPTEPRYFKFLGLTLAKPTMGGVILFSTLLALTIWSQGLIFLLAAWVILAIHMKMFKQPTRNKGIWAVVVWVLSAQLIFFPLYYIFSRLW